MKRMIDSSAWRVRRGVLGWGVFVLTLGALLSMPFGGLVDAADEAPGKITFVGKNKMATANGIFHEWHFTKVVLGSGDVPVNEVAIEVDVASLDTKIKKRDNHLRTADFFDVENFPTATLRIYDISKTGGKEFSAKLDFEMHGVQKTYDDFAFTITGRSPLQVEGEFSINRMDFNIGEPHKKLNPMSVGEEIPIAFSATLPAKDLLPDSD